MESVFALHPSTKQTYQTMDSNTNFRITIPKPCHEDWNKFTPDEKGAFCKVCSKSVHDFTKKEPEQIKAILIEEMSAGNKVCGRFNEDQISPAETKDCSTVPELNPYALNFRKMKRFAMALFLEFGGFLFNSTKSTAQKIMGKLAMPQYQEPVRGEIAISKVPEPVVKDTARIVRDSIITAKPKVSHCSKSNMMKGDVVAEPIEKLSVLGAVKAIPVEQPTVKGNAVFEPMGQVAIIETAPPTVTGSVAITEYIDIKDIEEPIIGDTVIEAGTTQTVEEPMIMGMMVAEPYNFEPTTIINPIPSDSIQNIIDGEFAVEESTYVETETQTIKGEEIIKVPDEQITDINVPKIDCYPNPSSNGEITLRYNLKKDGVASISLFDLKGNLVKTFLPAQSLYASSYETKYDVSDLNDGIYFCELISGGNKTTTRIVISK